MNAKELVTMIAFVAMGLATASAQITQGQLQTGSDEQLLREWTKVLSLDEFGGRNYSIGETEVTQVLWQAVMGSNPSDFTGNLQCPVECVSWNDCQTFITKLNQLTGANFRLPTEAEWEYAARGGSKSKGYQYAGSNTLGDVAWYGDNAEGTHAVGTKAPNELGLHDMSGNVYEWCQDWYSGSYYSSSPSTNPTGPASGSSRVNRGGGWRSNAGYCRVSYRDDNTPSYSSRSLGLRLAL